MPYSESFESGLDAHWQTYVSEQGRVQISSEQGAHSGTHHLLLDDTQGDHRYSLAEAILTLDLDGRSGVELRFWHKSFHDESHPMPALFTDHCNADGVAISVDGIHWYKVQGLTAEEGAGPTYKQFVVPLDSWVHGVMQADYVESFMIKFQQYDDSSVDEDGAAFDDIEVLAQDETPTCDLLVDMQLVTATVTASNEFHFTLLVTNAGPNRAESITVISGLDTNGSFTFTPPGFVVDEQRQVAELDLPSLEAHDDYEVAFVVCPLNPGGVLMTSRVSSITADADPLNNIQETSVAVQSSAGETVHLWVGIQDYPHVVGLSNELAYTLSVSNQGPDTATQVSLYLALSTNAVVVSVPESASVYPGLVALALGDLPAGEVLSATVTVQAVERGFLSSELLASSEGREAAPGTHRKWCSSWIGPAMTFTRVLDGIQDGQYVSDFFEGGTDLLSPALADIDGDGDLDLFASSSRGLVFYKNIGTPQHAEFGAPVASYLPMEAARVAFCDIDGDLDLDLFAGGDSGSLTFYENLGGPEKERWSAPQTDYNGIHYLVDLYNPNPTCAPALADLDADGDYDLFVGTTYGIDYYRNIGTPTQPAWANVSSNYAVAPDNYGSLLYKAPTFCDLDHDGDQDLVVGGGFWNAGLMVVTNSGSPEIAAWSAPAYPYAADVVMYHNYVCCLGDLDADGDSDLLLATKDSNLEWYENQGSPSEASWSARRSLTKKLDAGALSSPTFGDLDADGDLDVVLGGSNGQVPPTDLIHVMTNRGNALQAQWQALEAMPANIDFFRHPLLYDVDADSDLDLLLIQERSFPMPQSVLFLSRNLGTDEVPVWDTPAGVGGVSLPFSSSPALCDIDDDGDADLFVGNYTGQLAFFRNTGSPSAPTWTWNQNNYAGVDVGDQAAPFFCDIDEDGDQDLFVGCRLGTVHFFENRGSVSLPDWAPGVSNFFGEIVLQNVSPCFVDIDLDGDLDGLAGTSGGGMLFYRNEQPQARLSPLNRTVSEGEIIAYSLEGLDNSELAFSLLVNGSGAALQTPSGLYTAGDQGGLDVIEVRSGSRRLSRAYVNVVPTNAASGFDRAILVAGRNTAYAFDPVWLATDYLADTAYSTLRYLGYPKTSLQYVSPVADQDVDGDGLNDVDLETSLAHVELSFTNWAAGASNLFVYLVDHGGTNSGGGYLRLSPTEILAATNLDAWLDDLQNRYETKVTVLLDFCNAGSFLASLSWTGTAERVVIAAAADQEPAFFVAGGHVSFSEAFFNALLQRFELPEAFRLAQNAMSDYQSAWLDDNGDGLFNKDEDGTNWAQNASVGGSSIAGRDIPQVAQICSNQTLSGDRAATLWAEEVSASYPIEKVWAIVVPPGFNPTPGSTVVDLPEVELFYSNGRYEATHPGFNQPGTYKIIYYARDVLGGTSLPKYGYVTQAGADERLILAVGASTNALVASNATAIARMAYNTFLARQFSGESILCLHNGPQDFSNDGTNDVDALPTLGNLSEAITNWAGAARKLTVYLLGEGEQGLSSQQVLRLNSTETLSATNLDAWLDHFQASNRPVVVVMDFAGAGAWVTNLTAPVGRERVVIASCKDPQPVLWEMDSWISFSRIFLSYVFKGSTLKEAFTKARTYTFNLTHSAQDPQLDDNGNGRSNEKAEGALAKNVYIGSAFVTGAEAPVIGSVTPDTTLVGTNLLTLWASEIVSEAVLSNVWCVITPPALSGAEELITLSLTNNESTLRYEVDYAGFTNPGVYYVTYYAMNVEGHVSSPKQTEVFSADGYEPDDQSSLASGLEAGQFQRHNFHRAVDEDWMRFSVGADQVYEFRTVHLGTNVDTVVDFYFEEIDGSLSWVATVDDTADSLGEGEYRLIEDWPAGIYCARVRPYSPSQTGFGSEYDVQFYEPQGGLYFVNITALWVDYGLYVTNALYPGTAMIGEVALPLGTNGSTNFPTTAFGTHLARVIPPPGYVPRANPYTPSHSYDTDYGNPRWQTYGPNNSGSSFWFVPYMTLTGTIRDALSGRFVEGARIECLPANGRLTAYSISNRLFRGYPFLTSYPQLWTNDLNQPFPIQVYLPPVGWTVMVSCVNDGYSNYVTVITNGHAIGSVVDLGTIWMQPKDQNGNGLQDKWENSHGLTNGVADKAGDTDSDGMNNWLEYLCGTDPTDVGSVFTCDELADGHLLRWPVVRGHIYSVWACDDLSSGDWTLRAGPWICPEGQNLMEWTDPLPSSLRCYRIHDATP